MQILLIGLGDSIEFISMFENYMDKPFTYFYSDKIETALKIFNKNNIDFFVCDVKFGYAKIKNLIESLGDFTQTKIRGAYVGEKISNDLAILAINTSLIVGIITRPLEVKDFLLMKEKYKKAIKTYYFYKK